MTTNILDIVFKGLRDILEMSLDQAIAADAHLKNDLGIDSISSMDLLMYLEDHIDGFTVNADTLEARHFNTPTSMTEYIESELVRLNISYPAKTRA